MTVPAWLYFVTVLPLAALGGAGVVGLWQWGKIPVTYGSHAAPRTDVEQASANVTAARAKLAASLDQLSDASRREFVELGPDPEDDGGDWPAILRGPLDVEDQGADVPGAIALAEDHPYRGTYVPVEDGGLGDGPGDVAGELDPLPAPLARPFVAAELPAAVPFSAGPASAAPAQTGQWPATVTVPGGEA